MKAIIIEEDRFADLCDLLRLEKSQLIQDARTATSLGWDKNIWEAAVNEAHRSYHFHFVRWAQSHGARCIR